MNKLFILIFALLCSNYTYAINDNNELENTISISQYSQDSDNTQTNQTNGCVWPPCDDDVW